MHSNARMSFFVRAATSLVGGCKDEMDCAANGVCGDDGQCQCDAPWMTVSVSAAMTLCWTGAGGSLR